MKTYVGVDVLIHIFSASTLVGGKRSTSRPGRFILGKGPHGTHWIEGWVGPRAGLDDLEKITFLTLTRTRNLIPRSSSP
jgi:hypothetical protein